MFLTTTKSGKKSYGLDRFFSSLYGKPVAEIRPVFSNPKKPRPFGLCAGEFTVPDDFDAPLPENIIQEFEGISCGVERSLASD